MSQIIGKFMNVWLHPFATLAAVKDQAEEGIKPSIIFIVVMGIITGLITAVMSFVFPPPALEAAGFGKAVSLSYILLVPIMSFIGSFIGAFFVWGFAYGFLKGGMAQYKTAYRLLALLAAFSPVIALVSPLPVAGLIIALAINVWMAIVFIKGVISALETPPVRTWVLLGIIYLILLGFNFAARAISEQAANFNLPAGDYQFDEEAFGDLTELEDLEAPAAAQ